MEDECHKLDLEMATSASMASNSSDKEGYTNFAALIQRERELLDKKKNLDDQLKFLDQTLSLLILTSASANPPSPPVQAVQKAIEERKKKVTAVVRNTDCRAC